MEDFQIIDLYWQRNETAITETDTKYGGFCRRISNNILHNPWDSEECVNDAYSRCWDTMPPQRPMSLRAYLGAWLKTLEREDRALFVRRYWNGDSVKLLAGELGLRPNALTKRLLRLRENLRRQLEREGVSV